MKSILFILPISIFFIAQASAQGSNNAVRSLQLENTKTHRKFFLEVNQTVTYKLPSSQDFIKDKVSSITDSTISFYNSYKLLFTSASGVKKEVIPGMGVKVILKNGERIVRVNVLRISSEKIEGTQSSPIGVEVRNVRKKILIKDIESIDEWDSNNFNTGGGVNTMVVENISFLHKDFAAIKIQRSKGDRAFGTVLMVIGGLGTFIGIASAANPPSGSDPSGVEGGFHEAGLIIGAVGVPLLAGGIALSSNRKIVLDGKWSLTAKKPNDK